MFLGLSIGKDRLVDISAWYLKDNIHPDQAVVTLRRSMLTELESGRFGRFITCGAGTNKSVMRSP